MADEPENGAEKPDDFPLRGDPTAQVQNAARKAGPSPQAKLGVAVMLLAGAGFLGYSIIAKPGNDRAPMKTSSAAQLSPAGGGADVARIVVPSAPAKADSLPVVLPAPVAASAAPGDDALRVELATLKAQVQALQSGKPDDTGLKGQIDALRSQIAKMEDQNAADVAALSAQLKASQLAGQDASAAADARAKAVAEAAMQARIASKSVVYDGGQSGAGQSGSAATADGVTGVGSNMAGIGGGPGTAPRSADAQGRSFVQDAQSAPPIERATKIADPAHTALQGTVIQATLETGINSNLPGQLVAVVSYPVYSFDQSRVLIPVGSKLFGNYSSDIGLGQSRVLVGWTRLVKPDGQSVNMKAFGADDQGVSGVGGDVHSRFGLKFGSAALISLIATAPQVAASKATNQSATTATQSVGQDLSGATQSAIGAYVTLPNVITVDPGTAVSVIVDRDLGIY